MSRETLWASTFGAAWVASGAGIRFTTLTPTNDKRREWAKLQADEAVVMYDILANEKGFGEV